MALPSGSNYAISSLPNPASDQTGVVVGIDVSRLPQEWWDEVDTTDPTKARAALNDGTELAFDFETFDSASQSGWIWVRVAGTIPASGDTPKIRIYPPKAANTSYSTTATYGRNATWVDYEAVLHLNEDPSQTFIDATGNGYNGTAGAGLQSVDGKFGNAVFLDAYDDKIVLNSSIIYDEIMSAQAWLTPSVDKNNSMWTGARDTDNYISLDVTNDQIVIEDTENSTYYFGQGYSVGTEYKTTVSKDSGGNYKVYNNGTQLSGTANGGDPIYMDSIGTGFNSTYFFDGRIEEYRVANFNIGDDRESYEYLNEDDQAGFWGTWSWGNDTDNTHKLTITADSTLSVNGNDVLAFDFELIRAKLSTAEADEFWNNVQSGGGDLRVYYNDGSSRTRVAIHIAEIDTAAEKGYMVIDATNHAASTATQWDIEFGNSLITQPAPTDPYGRNQVWSAFEMAWVMESDPSGAAPQVIDATGNGHDQSTFSAMTSGDEVNSLLGNAYDFDGADDALQTGSAIEAYNGASALSIFSTVNLDANSVPQWVWAQYNNDGLEEIQLFATDGGDYRIRIDTVNGISTVDFGDTTPGNWDFLTAVYDGSNITGYVNGDNGTSAPQSGNILSSLTTPFTVGARDNAGTVELFLDGQIGFVAGRTDAVSAGYTKELYSNFSNQAGFWSVSNVEAISTALVPNNLAQPHSLTGSSVSANYNLVVDSGLHSQLLDSSAITAHSYSVVPNDILEGHTLESGAITGHNYSLVSNELLQDHLIDGSAITGHNYSVNPEDQQLSHLLESGAITGHNYIVLPEELTHNHQLDQSELIVVGDILLVPESIEHPHSIDKSSLEVLYSLLPTDMKQNHSVDSLDISVAYKLTPDQLDQNQLLGSGSITTNYLITPDDLSQSQELEQALLKIIGDASQVNLDANELYLINLQEEKLYKVKLEEQEQYEMNIKVEERVN